MLFYMIFGTNLLTQSPVPVSVFPCFRVSQKRLIKQSPIDLKLHETYFWTRRSPRSIGDGPKESWAAHEGGGRAPYLVGPLVPLRLQLQLYILCFREKKIRENNSSRFTIRSCRQALKPLGRADLESVRGSGEGDSSPSSSSTILHHQFHDAHRRA